MIRRQKLRDGWYFECRCARCRDPSELGLLTSATACVRCFGTSGGGDQEADVRGVVLPLQPLDPQAEWRCTTCGHKVRVGAILS